VYRSDPKLVEACVRGEQGAWDQLVDRYGRLVYSIARRYQMSDADADDVFQNVFVILLRRLESLRDTTRLSAWLITTTHRECWRVGKRGPGAADIEAQIADVGQPSPDQAAVWEEQDVVRRALERLGGSCQELLQALFMEEGDRSYEVIAERLGMKVGSIGPTRARCFRKLEKLLLDLGLQPPADE
jgi:RNA polymerase sigma factor (sigma-70 family)